MESSQEVDIVLLRPYVNLSYNYCRMADTLGLGYLSSYLKKEGYRVEIIDALLLKEKDCNKIVKKILACKPKVLGATVILQYLPESLKKILKKIKKQNSDIITVMGGHFPTLAYQDILTCVPEIDFIIRHEGEIALTRFMELVKSGGNLFTAPNLAYRYNGSIRTNPSLPLISDIDAIPFPDKIMIPEALKRNMLLSVIASRGCFEKCSFCSIAQFYSEPKGKAWRGRSPQNVVDELEWLIKDFDIKQFIFADDIFVGPGQYGIERCHALADEMIRRGINLEWGISTRANDISKELFEHLKQAGLRHVFIGIENFVQKNLDNHVKRMESDTNVKAIRILQDLGISVQPGFIMIDPYTTLDEIIYNVRVLTELGLGDPMLYDSKLDVYASTPLEKKLMSEGLIVKKGMDRSFIIRDPQVALAQRVLKEIRFLYQPYTNDFLRYHCAVTFRWREKFYNISGGNREAKIKKLFWFENFLNQSCSQLALLKLEEIKNLDLENKKSQKDFMVQLNKDLDELFITFETAKEKFHKFMGKSSSPKSGYYNALESVT